ncbi:MAG TPA: GC-type dockerin domain-anchored protein [Phycisphaerales bacterium]|nr:GC-type dockerin domain-anchored protein [Phycisphaerales bacterium]
MHTTAQPAKAGMVRLASASILLAAAGAAHAAPLDSETFTSVNSHKLSGHAANAVRTIAFGQSGGNVRSIKFAGTLAKVHGSTSPRDAAIRCRRYIEDANGNDVLTHDFIAQPFSSFTGFSGQNNNEAVVPSGAFALPVPASLNFNGAFAAPSNGQWGHWSFEFFEQFDDSPNDNTAVPDAIWSTITITLDDEAPSTATAAPVTGTVAWTSRYGMRSDDTLGPGVFTGGFINNLATPVNTTRIRHARVTGYITSLTPSLAGNSQGITSTGDARVRLVRQESVQLSPNDPAPFLTTDDLFFEVPVETLSTGYVEMNIPIPAGNDFGKLTRNVPTSDNETYYGISYYANFYESADGTPSPDNVWNWVKVELFSDVQAPTAVNAGTLNPGPGQSFTWQRNIQLFAGQVAWVKFHIPQGVSEGAGTWLDIDTEGSQVDLDTLLGVYGSTPANIGDRLAWDDDDGSERYSQLSFGEVGPRPAFGNSVVRNGRDGSLVPGTYYVAVTPYVTGTGTAALGTTDFNVVNATDSGSDNIRINLRYGKAAACGLADVGSQGGIPGPDSVLDNNDFIVFIDQFFAQTVGADRGSTGGVPGGDGQYDNNDFVVFIDQFFAGC